MFGLFIVAALVAYLIFSAGGAHETGGDVRWTWFRSLRWAVGTRWVLHIHHWLYLCLVAALALLMLDGAGRVAVVGFCAGGVGHGLGYSDWHQVLYRVE